MTSNKSIIIVGASSGLGAALAKRFAKAGYRIALLARRENDLIQLTEDINRKVPGCASYYVHDVTNFDTVSDLFQKITHDLDGFHTLVYCAGVMPPVAADEYNLEKDLQVMDVNVMGAMAWFNEAAVRCESQQQGTLVGISSVAGDRGRKGQPVYCTSKAALNTYLEGLRNRLGHRGVKVLTIKPGPMKTPMTEGLGKMPFMITAEEAANQIYKAIRKGKLVTYVPKIWWPIMTAIRMVPSFLFRGKDI